MPDYAALAKQFGGVTEGASAAPPVDYAALAAQFGGQTESKASQAAPEGAAPEGALSRFARNAWDKFSINPLPGLAQAVMHPITTAQNYAQDRAEHPFRAAMASAFPIIPQASQAVAAGEQIAKGDVAGGLGSTVGLVGSEAAGLALPHVLEGTADALRGGAKRIISSNLKLKEALVNRNPGMDIPGVVLDSPYSPNYRGPKQAQQQFNKLEAQLNANAAAVKEPLDIHNPLDQALQTMRDEYSQNLHSAPDLAQIDRVRESVMTNPRYSSPVMRTELNPVKSPILDAQGNAIINMVPSQVQVGTKLNPVSATEVGELKTNVRKGKTYGLEQTATKEADKTIGHALMNIEADNVPDASRLNKAMSEAMVAKKALKKMVKYESNKSPVGLLDLAAMGAGGGVAVLGSTPLGAAIAGGTILLKHPTTAFPIARTVNRVGNMTRAIAPAALPTVQTAITADSALRKPTKQEVEPSLVADAQTGAPSSQSSADSKVTGKHIALTTAGLAALLGTALQRKPTRSDLQVYAPFKDTLLEPGNIDLFQQPRVKNSDGSISTVRSIGVNIDGQEVVIPTVVGNKVVSDDAAVAAYRRTGKHLGKFATVAAATAFAKHLHEDYAAGKFDRRTAAF